MNPEIVPLCLYQNHATLTSYIGYPSKVRRGDRDVLVCTERPDTEMVAQFYVVNPDFRPIPPGMDLICAEDSADAQHATIAVEQIYDPFNLSKHCVRFLAWMEPIPRTTPLYIFQSGQKIHVSFSNQPPGPEFKQTFMSPIYVLVHPDVNAPRVPTATNGQSDRFIVQEDGQPLFLFSGYQGRCIPDPNGTSLGRCTVLYTKDILNSNVSDDQPTLLEYIDQTYNQPRRNFFAVNQPFWTVIIGLTFFIALFVLISNK